MSGHLPAITSLAICGSRTGSAVTTIVDGVIAPLSQFLHQYPCQVHHGPVGIGIEVMTYLADHYRPPHLEEVIGLLGHHNVVRRAEYVLVIGGGPGTNDEVDLAFSLGKKLIPFAASGGAAQRASEMLLPNEDDRQWLTPEDLETLLAATSPEKFVGHVRRLVAGPARTRRSHL